MAVAVRVAAWFRDSFGGWTWATGVAWRRRVKRLSKSVYRRGPAALRLFMSGVFTLATVFVAPIPVAYGDGSPGHYITGGGSGGGGGGDYWNDLGVSPNGGSGAAGSGTITGTSGDDVIFGDGSGGGGGGSSFRNGSGGSAGGGAETINGGAGDDIIFGDGFTGGPRSTINGGAGGFGGGGGGGGAEDPDGNGGTGGLLAGGGGALYDTTVGASQYGGYSGGIDSKPSGGYADWDNQWGGNSAVPISGSQGLGGTGYNMWSAGGGAGFGGDNSIYCTKNSGQWYYTNGGMPQSNHVGNGSSGTFEWNDSTGGLWDYVDGQVASGYIFSTTPGTTYGVGSGADTIDGGAGSDELFGLGGNDTFKFERDDAGSSDTDTIWDFDRLEESDMLSLYVGGALIGPSTRDALIAAQTTSGSDRSVVFTDGSSHSVTIVVKNIGRDLTASDFNAATVDPATVVTAAVSDVTSTSASSGGNVTSEGGDPVTARGVCWGTSTDPTTADSHSTDGTGTGAFTSSITGLSANTRYYVRAYATNSGGTSYGSDVSFFYDTEAPVTTATGLADAADESWRNTSATVSFSAVDALSGVALTQYAQDGGGWNTYSTAVSIGGDDGSHAVTYRSTDESGNVEATKTGYVNIDTVAPSLEVSTPPSGWQTTAPVTVGASAEDTRSGLAGIRYSTNGAATTATYTAPVEVSTQGTTTLGYAAIDNATNQSATQTVSVKLDTEAPVTTATGLETSPGDTWQTSDTWPFSLSATDTGSGVVATTYTVDAQPGELYTGPVLVTGEGTHTITYASEDVVGHVETTHTGYINIDSVAPTTTISGVTDSVWTSSTAEASFSATDAVSGVEGTRYSVNGAAATTYTAAFSLAEGTSTIGYCSVDVAGNVEDTHTVTALIDRTPPSSVATGPTGVAGVPATVTISATDALSGVAHTYYTLDGGSTHSYTTPIAITGDGTTTVTYWSVDEAGNVEDAQTLDVTTSEGPTTTIDVPKGWVGSDEVTVTIETSSPVSVAAVGYSIGSGAETSYTVPFTISDEGTTSISACSTDTNGMSRGEVTATVRIDRTPPQTTDDHSATYSGSATIHLSAEDTGSGVYCTRYRLDSGAAATGTVVTASTSGSHTVDYWSVDNVGNTEDTETITFSVASDSYWSVYRFRNLKNGYYLWTASEVEKNNIVATMSKYWKLEGVAYRINTTTNTSPLWRFRNLKKGYYFYTSDANEKNWIVANLSKSYKLEGVAYNVSRTSGPPVWRFRNLKNGTYFYTGDAAEKATIVATMSKTWKLEGVAYLIAP